MCATVGLCLKKKAAFLIDTITKVHQSIQSKCYLASYHYHLPNVCIFAVLCDQFTGYQLPHLAKEIV